VNGSLLTFVRDTLASATPAPAAVTRRAVIAPALQALEEGETERGLELLLSALREADPDARERIRQVMVGVFAELGQDHPLAVAYRRRLASALY